MEIFKNGNASRLYIYLMINCDDNKEVVCSYKSLALAVELSIQQIRTAISFLISIEKLAVKIENKKSVLKIVNFGNQHDKTLKSNTINNTINNTSNNGVFSLENENLNKKNNTINNTSNNTINDEKSTQSILLYNNDLIKSKNNIKSKSKDNIKKKNININNIYIKKEKFLENVFLTTLEYSELIDQFGEEKTKYNILVLNNYIAYKKASYPDHYLKLVEWILARDLKTETEKSKTDKLENYLAENPDDKKGLFEN